MNGTEEHHSEGGYPGSEDQRLYVLPHMWTLDSRANTAMWLDLGHMIRGEHTQDVWGDR
jgi:hypothetical protein